MSEYWKSTPKYWCKHCSAYVRDTPFERRQHESTAKHQNSLKRFLRDIQNNHEKAEREKARAKAEVERLNKIAGSSGAASSAKSTATVPAASKEKSSKPTAEDQKRQWQQLAEMGIQVPDQVRTEMALAGDWQTVRQPSPEIAVKDRLSVGVRKRKAEEEEEDEEDQLEGTAQSSTKRKVWGTSIKYLPQSEEDDLDALLATSSIPLKKEQQQPKLKQEGGHVSIEKAASGEPMETQPKIEEAGSEAATSSLAHISSVPEAEAEVESTSTPVFKKRKAKGKS